MQNKGKHIALIAGAAAVMVGFGATPAFAEGTFSSTISGARPGYDSSSWQDSHNDSKSTIVALSNCSLPKSGGLEFDIELKLYDEYGGLPDQSVGTKARSSCGSFNWGQMTRSDRYHWNLFALSGSTSRVHTLNAKAVTSY
ncbi:hypothetical protein [Curtobacterium herbarum]|uniref:Secreted protein n=1 Tax=Curtobacterium herbarum TaxID=150122 RepID=A0ABP4K423_9MICO|nr:hypothetical protein [Curtobacterium herbarum]MBM7475660.1 hypothetical protein [Curtobacterium herbarum]MCS6543572.1 hypothetical protein [Curtobacterium herbarum]